MDDQKGTVGTSMIRYLRYPGTVPTVPIFLDEIGWRDRGVFQCYAENGFGNATERVEVKLNYHYRLAPPPFSYIISNWYNCT